MAGKARTRRLPVGAEVVGDGVHFRVWAPRRRRVDIVLEGGPGSDAEGVSRIALAAEEGGYFSGLVAGAGSGTLYRFVLDDCDGPFPDPASRFQPQGPHGPSRVVDPNDYRWHDADWPGVRIEGQVIYELHVGTFTREGTWEAAARELPELRAAGLTLIEVMPVAEFPGRFGWGYDGVDLYAPTRLYGEPDDFRRFVDAAHACGLGVILDVVYNHLGPDGNYLEQYSKTYFTDRYSSEWGAALNFDGEGSRGVREFFAANARYWIDEFHLDGLRLDATQCIFDASPGEHMIAEIIRHARLAAGRRSIVVIAENEPQHSRIARPLAAGGYGADALWNDDFHHSAMVALTGRAEAYYSNYEGSAQELLSALKWGFLFQGQHDRWQNKRRGMPAFDLPPAAFVVYTQNHDQVANSARALRAHQITSPARHRAMTALLLLAPGTPMLFQGQEFSASSPFHYFADHDPEIAACVREGRRAFLAQFPSIACPEVVASLADPGDPATFERCKLDLSERARNAEAYALHKDLLRLRREDPVLRAQRPRGIDGAVLGPYALVLRYFGGSDGDRLLLVNLGAQVHLDAAPEPLLAPPQGARWQVKWASEDPRYGGQGAPHPETGEGWRLQGEAAVLMVPALLPEEDRG